MAILDPSRQQTDLASLKWHFGSVPQQRWPPATTLVSLEYPLRAYIPNDRVCGTLWVVNDRVEALVDCHLMVWLDDRLVHEQDCGASTRSCAAAS